MKNENDTEQFERDEIKLAVVITALWVITMWYVFFGFLNTPEVHKSWSTQECKYVLFSDGHKEPCGDLSRLGGYDQVWVE